MDTILDKFKEKYGAQLTFQPIDFLNIPGFPNYSEDLGDASNWLPPFHGDYGDSAIWHWGAAAIVLLLFFIWNKEKLWRLDGVVPLHVWMIIAIII